MKFSFFNLLSVVTVFSLSVNVIAKDACSDNILEELLQPATLTDNSITLNCSVKLLASNFVTKRVIFSGDNASGVEFDCGGATLDGSFNDYKKDIVEVRSKLTSEGRWEVPKNISLKNCHVKGSIRIYGMGKNGQSDFVRASSLVEVGHSKRLIESAPSAIKIQNFIIEGVSRIPLYLGPGTNNISLENSHVTGYSGSTAIYLDTESRGNVLKNNTIDTNTEDKFQEVIDISRELIAIDSSRNNIIVGNRFSSLSNGGIYLYRNCGEGGTIRISGPQENHIINNYFYYDSYEGGKPSIDVGSRKGLRLYCYQDAGYPYGSSSNDLDFASNNIIAFNQFQGTSPEAKMKFSPLSVDSPNFVYMNEPVSARLERESLCYSFIPNVFVNSGSFVTFSHVDLVTGERLVGGYCNNGTIENSVLLSNLLVSII